MDSIKLKSKLIQSDVNNNAKLFNSGIRKQADSLRAPNFIEIVTQALLHSLNPEDYLVIIGGDGRTYSREVMEKMIHVLIGNGVQKIVVPLDGHITASAAACSLRDRKCHLGFVVSGGHHPPGNNGFLGLKIFSPPGAPIREEIVDKANRILKLLQSYSSCEKIAIDFSTVRKCIYTISERKCVIEVMDIVTPYINAIKQMFDLPSIKEHLQQSCFKLMINCSGGVTGSIVKRIFIDELAIPSSQILNAAPLEDFGGNSPEPSALAHSKMMNLLKEECQFGAVISPDGCRCMIVGEEGFVVPPSDSLAIVAALNKCIPCFQENKLETVFRSTCTSQAVDKVAKSLNLIRFEVPVGWQNFSIAMFPALGKAILFGEESYGLGISTQSFCGERDGIWTTLAWLSIITAYKKGVKEITEEHWKVYGRSFFVRLDFCNISCNALDTFLCYFREKYSLRFSKIKSENFTDDEYIDPFGIDPRLQTEEAKKRNTEIVFDIENYVYPYGFIKKSLLREDEYQYYQIRLMEDARLIIRRSETISNSSTLRFYIEYTVDKDDEKIFEDRLEVLQPFIKAAMKITKIEDFISSECCSPIII